MKLEIIFENEDYIAFNKPSGLLSIPDRFDASLPNLFSKVNQGGEKLWMVHRLDRETSGLICLAKNEEAHRYLSQLFQKRKVEKYYQALVHGNPIQPSGAIEVAIAEDKSQKGRMKVMKSGKPAHTDYEVIKRWKSYSLLELQLHTGRTHQIRVHCAYLGHPIVCDSLYGMKNSSLFLSSFKKKFNMGKYQEEESPLLSRLALHAHQLRFEDSSGQMILMAAPLPKDMRATYQQLDKWNQ